MTVPRAYATLVAALLATTVAAGQGAQFTARRDSVRLDALVTKNGKPVTTLGPGDFDVFDNGVRQTVDSVSLGALPTNVILALDLSNSVAGDQLARLRQGGREVLAALKPGDQAALVTFTSAVAIRAPLTTDVGRVRDALDRASGRGDTSLVDGVFASLMIGDRDTARSLVIVFSDGVDSSSWLPPEAVLDTARRGSDVVYALVENRGRRPPFLDDLTAATGGSVVDIDTSGDLGAMFVRVVAEFRQRYVIGYSPSGVPPDGWHRIEIRVKGSAGRGVVVKTRAGYQVGGVIAN